MAFLHFYLVWGFNAEVNGLVTPWPGQLAFITYKVAHTMKIHGGGYAPAHNIKNFHDLSAYEE